MRFLYRTHIKDRRRLIYVISFLTSVYLALPIYITSTVLGEYIPETMVGIVFTASALAGILLLALTPRILRIVGNYHALVLCTVLETVGLITIALSANPSVVIVAFFTCLALTSILPAQLDIFLEDNSFETTTGDIRGKYLTAGNIGVLITPLMVSFFLFRNDFRLVFLVAALLTIPLLFLIRKGFRSFKDPSYEREPLTAALADIARSRNLIGVYVSNFLLYFFYSWMVIYTPVYLNHSLGFSWSVIGVIFTVMLLPFILLEMPLGRLSDKKWGEKEILVIGMIVMALSTGLLAFMTVPRVWLWAIMLCITRIGASFVEIGSETYFFKHVKSADAHLISIFRMTRPMGYVLGPLLATILLSFIDLRFLFLVLGIIMLFGIPAGLLLKDTK